MDDDWDFYPCRVDDAPGSIFLNLALLGHLADLPDDTLYVVRIEMRDGDAHGMGSAVEADTLYPIEDALCDELAALGVRFVGRLRNLGAWQLTFMGLAGHEAAAERIAHTHLDPAGRRFSVLAQPDPQWSYYTDFLFPDWERMRWIQDRRVVAALQEHKDPLTPRRRVDHWLYFPDERSRAACAKEAIEHGFEIEAQPEDTPDLGLQVHRLDSVELEAIHEVTCFLGELAERSGGEYDGWETFIVRQ